MDFVKAGKVVKFIDENGEKNAGTVVEIVKQQGIKKAVINTIEGKTIIKNLKALYLVKNEVRGKRSISVLKEVAEELGKEVIETKLPKKDSYLVVGDKVLKPLKVRTTESGESKTINELLTCILELNNLGELVVD